MSDDAPAAAGGLASFDAAAWASQSLWWSERQRSRPLIWPAGASWFSNDPLGPTAHTHPAASEPVFVAHGQLRLTVGSTLLHLVAGDYCLIPPDTFHDMLNEGDGPMGVFVMVAPNWRDRRWRPEKFGPADFRGTCEVVGTRVAGPLPGDERIEASVEILGPETGTGLVARAGAERTIYVLAGEAEVRVEHLSGRIGPDQFCHVMSGTPHSVSNTGRQPLRLLSIWAADPPVTSGPVDA